MRIRLASGQYKSITEIDWADIPPFAVVTGANGSGKTQLLELIARHAGVPAKDPAGDSPEDRSAGINNPKVECSEQINRGNTVFLSSYWQLRSLEANTDQWRQQVASLRAAQMPPDPRNRDLQANYERWESVWTLLEARAGKTRSAIDKAEFGAHLPPNFLALAKATRLQQNVSLLFLSYAQALSYRINRLREEFALASTALAPLPWDAVNDALIAAGLRYRVTVPEVTEETWVTEHKLSYRLQLIDQANGDVRALEDLSAGERVLFQVALWSFSFGHVQRSDDAKLLLLDEPDAYLHPAMTGAFLRVIRSELVQKYGVRVIMTTHSPSTVALAGSDSVFVMRRNDSPRLVKAPTLWDAIAPLTAGLVTVGLKNKTVFVEDADDASFFDGVQKALIAPRDASPKLDAQRALSFIRSSQGRQSGGVNQVIGWVKSIESSQIAGIVDRDSGRDPIPRVYVLQRRHLESYLLDPLYIYALLLHRNKVAPRAQELRLGPDHSRNLLSLPTTTLQQIVCAICDEYTRFPPFEDAGAEATLTEYVGGVRVLIPNWVLQSDLKPLIEKVAQRFDLGRLTRAELIGSYQDLQVLPADLVATLRAIQNQ